MIIVTVSERKRKTKKPKFFSRCWLSLSLVYPSLSFPFFNLAHLQLFSGTKSKLKNEEERERKRKSRKKANKKTKKTREKIRIQTKNQKIAPLTSDI